MILLAALAAAATAPDVARLLERREGCDHWAGEEPYDQARGREIAAALASLRCSAIERDEKRLRRKYARDAAALRLIDQAPD
ncbi:hypothetical protein HL653_08690 [Sphingomonas sp. AP4-R1]|uniref:hypothetical protein n=1 Tax=Sphingomonas sp. AP4-R1 TaxID=2735134 RepID=UPI0014939BBC|nr:hypothetical protein [Sphingomonas sp. AP4-R1]QJU57857.1 hypothetical protein HL653_08690 [Sphingomonas sp. AP4-R1]